MKLNLILWLSAIFHSIGALAQDAAAPQPGGSPAQGLLLNLPVILLLVALFYFVIIQPQKKQQKQHQDFLSGLSNGDEVVTASGLIGKIQGMTDKVVTLEISHDVEVKILRSQIQSRLKTLLESQNNQGQSKG